MVLLPIEGIEVDFPFQPYGVQRQYMARMISALRAGKNACLESPTGTGKSLSLLCASLAWRQAYVAALQLRARGGADPRLFRAVGLPAQAPAEPAAPGHPPSHTARVSTAFSGNAPAADSAVTDAVMAAVKPGAAPTALRAPRIVFSSRTHSQLSQAVGELRTTVYRPYMTVLASRDQLCVHDVSKRYSGAKLNNACRTLTAPSRRACRFHLAVASPREVENRSKQLLQMLKDQPPKDIEDLSEFGRAEGACPYFLTRAAVTSEEVEVLFLPYNFLLDGNARDSLGIDWANDIIIIDEAHNLESICSDVVSFDLTPTVRQGCRDELTRCIEKAVRPGGVSFPVLEEMAKTEDGAKQVIGTEDTSIIEARLLLSILSGVEAAIREVDLGMGGSEETGLGSRRYAARDGSFIRQLFAKKFSIGITEDSAPALLEALERAIDATVENVPVNARADSSAPSALASTSSEKQTATSYLKSLHNALAILFHPISLRHEASFRTVVHPADPNNVTGDRTLSYWCFSPAVALQGLVALGIRSLLLTSGTLSPMDSFSFELGVDFPVRLENRHVIGPDQVWAGVVSKGPDGKQLSSGYKTRDTEDYKISLGRALVRIAERVPDGILVFFPSYRAMDSCVQFWRSVGVGDHGQRPSIYELLCQRKRVIIEPRDSSEFAGAILAHQANIDTGFGSLLLAVCRGKVSEGIDFSDRYGRAVVMAGIPYPAAFDPKVILKREYMDAQAAKARSDAATLASSGAPQSDHRAAAISRRHGIQPSGDRIMPGSTAVSPVQTLTGEAWYSMQAVRAINQAIGRAIRHKNDYGVILLCDERFGGQHIFAQLSKWLRSHTQTCPSFQDAMRRTEAFFGKAKNSTFAKAASAKALKKARDAEDGLGGAGKHGLQPGETTAAVKAASKTLARFVPPRKPAEEMQAELDKIVADIGDGAWIQRDTGVHVTGTQAHSLLDVLGTRPKEQGLQGMGKRVESKADDGLSSGAARSASQRQVKRRRTAVAQASLDAGNKGTVLEDARRLFPTSAALRELFMHIRLLLAHAKSMHEQGNVRGSENERDAAEQRGAELVAKLVAHVRSSKAEGVSSRDAEGFLGRLRKKIPSTFHRAYDRALQSA